MDGSSSLSKYHQSFNNSNRNNLQDSDLLVTATSPLQLYVHSDPNKILWNNMSQSIRFCRPVMLECIKENKEDVLKIKEEVEKKFLIYIHLKFTFQDMRTFRSTINLPFQ